MKHTLLIGALAAPLAFGLACPALAQTSGSFSATLSGFQPTPPYSQLSASTVSNSVPLPVGTTVIVYNNGPSAAYVALGDATVTATTAGALIQPSNWMAFTVGASAYLAGVTSSGAAALVISGGMAGPTAGTPTGTAGSPNANVVSVQGVSGATALPVAPQLQVSNGLNKSVKIGITNSATLIFSGQHQLLKVDCDNNNGAFAYLQMFDATSGVNVGTTAPSDFKPLQPSLGGAWMTPLVGAQYSTGLMVAATTGPANGSAPRTTINCSFFYN